MIDGVKTKKLRVIPDERGRLMEILRKDDEIFEKFGQVYLSSTYPGVVKGWHMHQKQADNICCVHGMVKLVIYDGREDSPTKGRIDEFFIGSADMMHRNLDRRVEVLAQVKDPRLTSYLDEIFESAMDPSTRCWELGSDGKWTAAPQDGRQVRDHQVWFMDLHRQH